MIAISTPTLQVQIRPYDCRTTSDEYLVSCVQAVAIYYNNQTIVMGPSSVTFNGNPASTPFTVADAYINVSTYYPWGYNYPTFGGQFTSPLLNITYYDTYFVAVLDR